MKDVSKGEENKSSPSTSTSPLPSPSPSVSSSEGIRSTSIGENSGNGCLENLVIKGTLLKENWYRNKQLRYIELYNYGEIKYFSIEKNGAKTNRGSILICGCDEVKLVQKTIHIKCIKKGRTYYLIEPTTKHVNYA